MHSPVNVVFGVDVPVVSCGTIVRLVGVLVVGDGVCVPSDSS